MGAALDGIPKSSTGAGAALAKVGRDCTGAEAGANAGLLGIGEEGKSKEKLPAEIRKVKNRFLYFI